MILVCGILKIDIFIGIYQSRAPIAYLGVVRKGNVRVGRDVYASRQDYEKANKNRHTFLTDMADLSKMPG